MHTLVKIGIGIGILGVVVAAVPELKGAYNRLRNSANEKLSSEFVVDNYKAEYVSLHDKKQEIVESIQKFRVEQRIIAKKLACALEKTELAKKALLATGAGDIGEFNRAKSEYETAKTSAANFAVVNGTYSNAISRLERALRAVDANMNKAKANVATLESKKATVDSIASVNRIVENLNGIGDSDLGVSVEKLDDDMLRESIRMEALDESGASVTDKAAAEAYLKSLE